MVIRSTQCKDVGVFPEYQDLVTRLKTENARFVSLYDKHHALDQQIDNMQKSEPTAQERIEKLKREKLSIKDELYAMLKKASGASS